MSETRVVRVPVSGFAIRLVDVPKNKLGENTVNAGFFGTYHEEGEEFTLPSGHLTCDWAAEGKWTRHYGEERGRFEGDKFSFDCSAWSYQNQFQGKPQSTLVILDGKASIVEAVELPVGEYAISGVPVIRDGKACAWSQATAQGWGTSSVRPTWHTLVGLKEEPDAVYVIGLKSTSSNLVKSGEAAKVLLELGFRDVIKLDGGGSFYFDADGKTTSTGGSRRINTVITMNGGDSVTADKILSIAKKEIGTKENPAGSNRVKYNTDYYGKPVTGSAYPWCCTFVWWVFREAGASDLFFDSQKTAYCPTLLNYYKKKKQIVTDYKPGDIVFFNFSGGSGASHVGICTAWDGTNITTIDGNTGTDNEANGGAVMLRKRNKKYIVGVARPAYHSDKKMVDIKVPMLQTGSTGDDVKAVQILLKAAGHDPKGADGKWGANTTSAMKAFQKAAGLDSDGICGPASWTRLLGV